MIRFFKYSLILAAAAAMASCGGSSKKTEQFLPSITGKAGEVMVIMDKVYWEGEPGAELKAEFQQDYPFLPQKEAMFAVFNAPVSTLSGSFCLHRNLVVFNISDRVDSSSISYCEDVWATPQIVITVNAHDGDEALSVIRREKAKMTAAIEQAERNRLINTSKKYEAREIRDAVTDFLGGSPYFTQDFSIKKKTDDFIWVSHETTYVNRGLFFFKIPYVAMADATAEGILEKVDSVLKANVPGMREDSYMMTNHFVQPGLKYIQYSGRQFMEVRGLWELNNDYMGGPFICHVFPDSDNSRMTVLYGFVYAPKYEKRGYFRYVESILYSFEGKNL